MRERTQLLEDGTLIVVVKVDARSGGLLAPPDVVSRGLAVTRGDKDLVVEASAVVTKTLAQTEKKSVTDRTELKKAIRRDLSRVLSKRSGQRPIILPIVVEV